MPDSPRWMLVARWFIASRLIILALGAIGVGSFVDHRTGVVTESVAALNPETAWHKWDAVMYERIARHGYAYELDTARGQAAAAYFPLYPMTVRLAMAAAPSVSFFWTGSLLSTLFTFAALLLLARHLVDDVEHLRRVLLIVLTAAGSFYLSIPYAEGLFLLLVVATMIAARGGRYEIAALVAGLAATTRVHGFALVAVPVIACWLDRGLAAPARWRRVALSAALFAVPVLLYFAYQHQTLGAWNAFLVQQAAWDNPSPYPFQALTGFLHYPRRMTNWLHGAFWVLYLWLLFRYRRQIAPGEALFCLGVFLITTQQEAFHGTYRYMVPLIPLTLAIGRDRPGLQHALIAFNLVFGVLMLLAFVTYNRLTV